MRITVAKRNGNMEPFAPGRVALAIFKACQAQNPPIPSGEARGLAQKALGLIEKEIEARNSEEPAKVEWLQDKVIGALRDLGQESLADSYERYRQERAEIRSGRSATSGGKKIRFDKGSKALVLEEAEWLAGMEFALGELAKGYSPLETLEIAQKEGRARSYWGLAEALIEAMLERAHGNAAWLQAAGRVFLDAWAQEKLGVSLLRAREAAEKEHQALGKADLLAWRDHKRWFPTQKELSGICSLFSLQKSEEIPLSGLQILRTSSGPGDLPDVRFAKIAIALAGAARNGEGDRAEIAKRIFLALQSKDLVFPAQAGWIGEKSGTGRWALEWSLAVGDGLDGVFRALRDFAWLGKEGVSVSADLSLIRAAGTEVGSRKSAGVAPVLRLFAEAVGMLEASPGEEQKARLFLDGWHADLEDFLAFAKQAQPGTRLCLSLPDAFMKRVLEGGDWILASPSDAPKLASARGEDFDLWLNEAIRMGEFNALGGAKVIPAREVFEWICETIAGCGGPSIAFRDSAEIFGRSPKGKSVLSVKMGAVLPADPEEAGWAIECAARCLPEDSESALAEKIGTALEAANLASRLEEELSGKEGALKGSEAKRLRQLAICPIGNANPEAFGMALTTALGKRPGSGKWDADALWRSERPWEEHRDRIRKARGGMLTGEGWGGELSAPPEFASIVAISPREEYLWISGEPPCFVEKDSYRFQARQGKVIAKFGGGDKGILPPREQAERVAAWQKVSDQGVTWDPRIGKASPEEIGEAIKLAWLRGLSGVRRFVEK